MDAVIFDMDGVIVDSVSHWQVERRRVLVDELGLEGLDVNELVGMNTHDEYDLLAEQYDLELPQSEYVERLSENAMSIYNDRVAPLVGLDDLLETLAERDVTIGLATASYRHRAEAVLQRFDLASAFDAVVAADDLDGRSKPEPDIYLHTASVLGVDPERCVAVEDSRNGSIAAGRAGMYCIGYDSPEGPDQNLDTAAEVVSSPSKLADRLVELVDGDRLQTGA